MGGFVQEAHLSTVLGICFPLLILLVSCKVLNAITLPFSKQEEKNEQSKKEMVHFI